MMRRHTLIPAAVTALLLAVAGLPASADEEDDAELTMTLITDPDAELPGAVTRKIELPKAAMAQGMDNSDPGANNGNGPPGNGSRPEVTGQERAAEARELGKQFGQDMAEAAKENRENRGRGEPPEPPGRPDPPGNGPPQ